MFNYLKKHNMRNSLKMLLCLTAICVFSNNAAAKICFLPDGNCGKTKININSGENGCIYKDKDAAETGMSKCEIAFQRNSCWWRRCNSDNKTIFDKLADCQKKIEDATKQECQACGSCYKLVPISIPQNACPDGYSTKYQGPSDCGDNESFSKNGTYNGLVCGACTKTETCPSGYSTQYQSQSDCPTGETFSSSGSVGNLTCGKCVTCADENNLPIGSACYGLHRCDGREPVGETPCYCGTYKYYKKCMVEETCKYTDSNSSQADRILEENGGRCDGDGNYRYSWYDVYKVKEKCIKVDGTKIYWEAWCDTEKDCNGNPGLAYGLVQCGNDEGEGEPVECGGKKWFKSCACSYAVLGGSSPKYEYQLDDNGGSCDGFGLYLKPNSYGYYYPVREKCTKVDGTTVYWEAECTTEKDCNGNPGLAYGRYVCPNDEGVGEPIECGKYKWFKSCTCNFGNLNSPESDMYLEENGGSCDGFGYYRYPQGYAVYYEVKEKCTKDGIPLYWEAQCDTEKDCNGNPGPAYGLTRCEKDETATGTVVHCGSYDWGTSCIKKVECSYDFTEDMCAVGQIFVKKCHDNDNKWWGECI